MNSTTKNCLIGVTAFNAVTSFLIGKHDGKKGVGEISDAVKQNEKILNDIVQDKVDAESTLNKLVNEKDDILSIIDRISPSDWNDIEKSHTNQSPSVKTTQPILVEVDTPEKPSSSIPEVIEEQASTVEEYPRQSEGEVLDEPTTSVEAIEQKTPSESTVQDSEEPCDNSPIQEIIGEKIEGVGLTSSELDEMIDGINKSRKMKAQWDAVEKVYSILDSFSEKAGLIIFQKPNKENDIEEVFELLRNQKDQIYVVLGRSQKRAFTNAINKLGFSWIKDDPKTKNKGGK